MSTNDQNSGFVATTKDQKEFEEIVASASEESEGLGGAIEDLGTSVEAFVKRNSENDDG